METPFWWKDAPLDEERADTPASRCDVAIIGAGYAGLAAAIVLARAGRSVQVFDAMRPGEGASTRNGGIASGNLRHSFGSAIAAYGLNAALELFREGHEARADLARFVRDEKIDCDYQANGRFTGAVTAAHLEEQRREAGLLHDHLGIETRVIARADLGEEIATDAYCGGMVREEIATVHPAKLHAGMLAVARRAGATVFGHMPVHDYFRNRDHFELVAGRHPVRAGKLIVASNGYTGAADPWLRRRLVAVASRIVVTGELPPALMKKLLPKRRAMGETRKLFRYYRPTPDGRRILLGSREKSANAGAAENAAHVFAGLVDLFPEVEPHGFEYSWNGNVAFSRDEMPNLFEKDGIIYSCGFCGSGVVWARWLGARAAEKVLGERPVRSFFDTSPPAAIPFYRGKAWFLPAIMRYYRWRDRRAERS